MGGFVAVCPLANLLANNASLEALGFGKDNLFVPCYVGNSPTHAVFHANHDSIFKASVALLPGVVMQDSNTDPIADVLALVTSQGAKWGAGIPFLPASGMTTVNTLYRYDDDTTWWCITGFDRTTYPAHPSTYQSLLATVRNPHVVIEWIAPLYGWDAYKLVNPFTGLPDQCTYLGQTWTVTGADGSGNNVWVPGAAGYGWNGVAVPPPIEEWPAWKPWTSGLNADLYQIGAKVTYNGQHWIATTGNNHWTPGEFGWTLQP